MSRINTMIENRLRAVREDARFRPIIDQVKAAATGTPHSDALLAVALTASRDQFTREGKTPDAYEVRERAFISAAAASTEQRFTLSDLAPGADKTQHFFTSGMISLKVAEVTDKLLPRVVAEKLGVGASVTIGFFKEVYDQFFATGFNKGDLSADVAGAKRPFNLGGVQ